MHTCCCRKMYAHMLQNDNFSFLYDILRRKNTHDAEWQLFSCVTKHWKHAHTCRRLTPLRAQSKHAAESQPFFSVSETLKPRAHLPQADDSTFLRVPHWEHKAYMLHKNDSSFLWAEHGNNKAHMLQNGNSSPLWATHWNHVHTCRSLTTIFSCERHTNTTKHRPFCVRI